VAAKSHTRLEDHATLYPFCAATNDLETTLRLGRGAKTTVLYETSL
jgi:hypothetical protein